MTGLQDALRGVGLKSSTDIIKQKVEAMSRFYGEDNLLNKIITFTLNRVPFEDLESNHTLSKFERCYRDENIGRRNWENEFLKIYRETLAFDQTTAQVFKSTDIFTYEELCWFMLELPNRKLDEILSNILDTIVIVGNEKVDLYLSIPEDTLRKGGVLEVEVPFFGPSTLPMLIGKKGTNVKRMVQYLADIMTDGNTMVVTKINFVEPGWN